MKKVIEEFKNPPVEAGVRVRYWLPQGMVNDIGIHKDLIDLRNRGFSGVEVVPFDVKHEDLKGREWGSVAWYNGVESVLKYAKELGLKVDLAIGPQWPIAMPQIKCADDKAACYELTYGISEANDYNIPSPKVIHEEGTRTLVAIMAYRRLKDHVLIQSSYINLMDYVSEDKINYSFDSDDYVVFAFYGQPSCHKALDKYYVVDHYSKEGSDVCIDYWKEYLVPLIEKYPDVMENIFCDSLEFKCSMDWTRGFEAIFKEARGYDLLPYLPVIKQLYTYPRVDMPNYRFEDESISDKVTNDYTKVLSELYENKHLKPLQQFAYSVGLNVRYQVAYNKPVSIEDSASVVGICENESLGRFSIDNLRTMAGAVHLNSKPIYSAELNAEFKNSYGQTYKDILYWNKRAYLAGVNRQVLHGASYNGGYGDHQYFPYPGFEAFGTYVSNYWNRVPSHSCMKTNMDFLSRNNYILQKEHVVDFLVYREEFINHGKGEDGNYLLKDSYRLINNGYSFDYVSPKLLKQKKEQTKKYQGIIVSNLTAISKLGLEVLKNASIPVYLIGCDIKDSLYLSEAIDNYQMDNAISFKDMNEFISYLNAHHIYSGAHYLKEVEVGTIHTKDYYGDYYYIYNYNSCRMYFDETKGKMEFDPKTIYPTIDREHELKEKDVSLLLKGEGEVMIFNPVNGHVYATQQKHTEEGFELHLHLKKDESVIVAIGPYHVTRKDPYHRPIKEQMVLDKYKLDIYEYVACGATFYDHKIIKSEKKNLDDVFGYGIYTFEVDIKKETGYDYILSFDDVDDTYRIKVNGQNVMGISSYPHLSITHALVSGKNIIKVRVHTNLNNIHTNNPKEHFGIIGKAYISKV